MGGRCPAARVTRHASREERDDPLLPEEVLVDLYTIVRQAMQVQEADR